MTAQNQMTLVKMIKGTAQNKGKARVWVEDAALADFGLPRGERVTIDMLPAGICVRRDPAGKRKVAGREKNGRTICILDICFPLEQRESMFGNADRLAVFASDGMLLITAPADVTL